MSGTLNKVCLIGHLGEAPTIRTMQSGNKVASFSIATSERWKDKATGERKERTEWHRVAVFNQPLVSVAESYLKKGSRVYLEGQLETRSYEKDGQKHYVTEIVLRPFRGELTMLDNKPTEQAAPATAPPQEIEDAPPAHLADEFNDRDEIPF